MQQGGAGGLDAKTGQQRTGGSGGIAIDLPGDPAEFDPVGFLLVAHQHPIEAVARCGRQFALRDSCLKGNAGQRRGDVAIGRQFAQSLDQMPGNAQHPASGVVDIDPLEPGGGAGLHRLNQHGGTVRKQFAGTPRRSQQSIGDNENIVVCGDQARQGASAGHALEARASFLRGMLQFDHFGSQIAGDADDQLAIERQRQGQLVPGDRSRTDPKETAHEWWSTVGGLQCRKQGNSQRASPASSRPGSWCPIRNSRFGSFGTSPLPRPATQAMV